MRGVGGGVRGGRRLTSALSTLSGFSSGGLKEG